MNEETDPVQGYVDEEDYEPTEQEILEYCEWLGMDLLSDKVLSWIAREALKAPLPENWKICYTDDREVYYFNVRTGESIWDHPMDAFYKALFQQEKVKLERKRRRMRLFSGSFTILPLQDYFSDLDDGTNPDLALPEHLADPIDLRLFVDPVVLPTSGRTVSRRTIINNKWRDPFSREYVENRQLIPNVDKRNEVVRWLQTAIDKHFEALAAGPSFQPLLRLLPHILDKECEVALQAQTLLLRHVARQLSLPGPPTPPLPSPRLLQAGLGANRRNGRRVLLGTPGSSFSSASSRRSGGSARAQPHPPRGAGADRLAPTSLGAHELAQLGDDEVHLLLGALLTMSTPAASETLYLILEALPALRCASVLRGFSPEVLHALHLSPADFQTLLSGTPSDTLRADEASSLTVVSGDASVMEPLHDPAALSSSLPEYDLELTTSNSEHVTQLKWAALLVDSPIHLNIYEKLPWAVALHLAIITVNSCPELRHSRPTLVVRLLRGLDGWPVRLKEGPEALGLWLLGLALGDPHPATQCLLVYDLLTAEIGGEAAVRQVKAHREGLLAALLAASAVEGTQGVQGAAEVAVLLGALLIFQDCLRLSDLGPNKPFELAVANALLPRLTRQQWKPRQFEHTLHAMADAILEAPGIAWAVMGDKATLFLSKELLKKKRNCEEMQEKLHAITEAERQLAEATVHNNWALLALKLLAAHRPSAVGGPSGRLEEQERQREGLLGARMQSLVAVLHLLLAVRLKPKQPRDREAARTVGALEMTPSASLEKLSKGMEPWLTMAPGFRGRRRDPSGKPVPCSPSPAPPPLPLPAPGRPPSSTRPATRPTPEAPQTPQTCSLPPIT